MSIEELADELTAGHPDTGAYNADDALAAAEINAVNRPNTVSIDAVLSFLVMEKSFRTNDGTDTFSRSVWARMQDVDALAVTPIASGSSPWGSTSIPNIAIINQVRVKALLAFLELSAQGNLQIDFNNTKFDNYLTGAVAAGCMSQAQSNQLKALSDDLQSRAAEVGLGHVRVGHVQQARVI